MAPPKIAVVGAAVGPDGITRVLWQGASPTAVLWEISATGQLVSSMTWAAPAGQTATGIAVGPDNRKYLLWSGAAGQGQIWTMSGRKIIRNLPISLPGAGRASSLVVGASSDPRVFWRDTETTGRLQTFLANGSVVSVRVFPAYH